MTHGMACGGVRAHIRMNVYPMGHVAVTLAGIARGLGHDRHAVAVAWRVRWDFCTQPGLWKIHQVL